MDSQYGGRFSTPFSDSAAFDGPIDILLRFVKARSTNFPSGRIKMIPSSDVNDGMNPHRCRQLPNYNPTTDLCILYHSQPTSPNKDPQSTQQSSARPR